MQKHISRITEETNEDVVSVQQSVGVNYAGMENDSSANRKISYAVNEENSFYDHVSEQNLDLKGLKPTSNNGSVFQGFK